MTSVQSQQGISLCAHMKNGSRWRTKKSYSSLSNDLNSEEGKNSLMGVPKGGLCIFVSQIIRKSRKTDQEPI